MKDGEIKISIIIPIHNANKYVSRCLNSLLHQTLREIEIICVLDCPTDGTDKIVEEYAQSDSRIKVVYNETNLHTSASRNRGLQLAKGEYVGFHDHDDYNDDIHMYEELYRIARHMDADVVLSDAKIRYTLGQRKEELWQFLDVAQESLISSNILPMLRDINPQMLSHCVWSSIYRNKYLKQYSITFKDRREYLDEDRLFNFEVFSNTSKIAYLPRPFYVWEQTSSNLSGSYPAYLVSAQITRTQFYVDYLQQRGTLNKYRRDLWELLAIETKIYWKYYICLSNDEKRRLGKLMKDMQYPLLGYKYNLKLISKKRIQLILFNIRVRLA